MKKYIVVCVAAFVMLVSMYTLVYITIKQGEDQKKYCTDRGMVLIQKNICIKGEYVP
jgi:hypothetical protein